MVTLIKRHVIGLFALVLMVATMSFKMVEKSETTDYWFWVVNGDEIGASTSPPDNSEDCQHYNEKEMCKVRLNTPTPPSEIQTVQDARDNFYFEQAVSRIP